MERKRRNRKLTKELVSIVRLIANVHRFMKKEYETMQQKDPNADLSQFSNPEQRTADAIGVDVSKIRPMLVCDTILDTADLPSLMKMKTKEKIEIAVELTVESKTDAKIEVSIVPKNPAYFARIEQKYKPN